MLSMASRAVFELVRVVWDLLCSIASNPFEFHFCPVPIGLHILCGHTTWCHKLHRMVVVLVHLSTSASSNASLAGYCRTPAVKEEKPPLQWHLRFCEEATLLNTLGGFALGSSPHEPIRGISPLPQPHCNTRAGKTRFGRCQQLFVLQPRHLSRTKNNST